MYVCNESHDELTHFGYRKRSVAKFYFNLKISHTGKSARSLMLFKNICAKICNNAISLIVVIQLFLLFSSSLTSLLLYLHLQPLDLQIATVAATCAFDSKLQQTFMEYSSGRGRLSREVDVLRV